jgi:hypothetical protein
MALIGNLVRAQARGARKVSATQGAVTGTGGIATGLTSIDVGGAVACGANSATTAPTNLVTITSIAGGTVNIAVVAAAAGGNTISGVAENVNVIATGLGGT